MATCTSCTHASSAFVDAHDLIPPGGDVTCLVSGGADSTCLWHSLRELGYRVGAVHVHHGVRGAAADEDARHCAELMGAEVVRVEPAATEAAMRDVRYRATEGRGLRATGHTATDQIETVLYRIVSSGSTRGIKACREDGVVRPLLDVTRERNRGLLPRARPARSRRRDQRSDEAWADPRRAAAAAPPSRPARRGQPALARPQTHRASLARSSGRSSSCSRAEPARRPPTSEEASEPCASTTRCGSKAPSPGARGSSPPTAPVSPSAPAVPGDRLAGRRRKVQDLLVDAKVPRAERDGWPIVVAGRARSSPCRESPTRPAGRVP